MTETVTLSDKAAQLRKEALDIYANMKESRSFDHAALDAIMEKQRAAHKLDLKAADIDAKAAVQEAELLVAEGRVLKLREAQPLVSRILLAFKPTTLCLKGCQVPSDGHPGLHMGPPGGSWESMVPVCALPAELPHAGHMCAPGDVARYVICPTCKDVVAIRAAKRHVEAHLGVNRKDPKEARDAKVIAIRAFMDANPGIWNMETHVDSYDGRYKLKLGYIVKRYLQSLEGHEARKGSSFWLGAARSSAKKLGVTLPEGMAPRIAQKAHGARLQRIASRQAFETLYKAPDLENAHILIYNSVRDIIEQDISDAVPEEA